MTSLRGRGGLSSLCREEEGIDSSRRLDSVRELSSRILLIIYFLCLFRGGSLMGWSSWVESTSTLEVDDFLLSCKGDREVTASLSFSLLVSVVSFGGVLPPGFDRGFLCIQTH